MLDVLVLAQEAAADPAAMKLYAYGAFILLVLAFLGLDLGVFHREAHEVSMREAAWWSAVWLTCGLAFSLFVFFAYQGHWLGLGLQTPMYNPAARDDPAAPLIVTGTVGGAEAAELYLTGYIVEKSLAMDNIFVIALIFSFFAIPGKYQHRVLFWGIIGALLMRGAMIFAGAGLIMKHQWILIVFGGFLVLTAVKMALVKGNDDPSQNLAVRLVKRFVPVADFYDGARFFTRRSAPPGREPSAPGPWKMTPLFLALILVEVTDLVFAVDSIPAIFAITPDPFLVFTSNIFAILGLRSLYFCLAALMTKFRFLKAALIVILAFVGIKLLLLSVPPNLAWIGLEPGHAVKIDTTVSLAVVVGTLALATALSVAFPRRTPRAAPPPPATPPTTVS